MITSLIRANRRHIETKERKAMIKVFYTNGSHINYVDQNNRYAGMCDSPECCENVGTRVFDKDGNDVEPDEKGVFENLEFANAEPEEKGDEVHFKLIDPSTGEEYTLEFYNYHNGYYYHTVEYGEYESKNVKETTI